MDLTQIEALAEKLYNPQNAQERQLAEQSLSLPAASPEALNQCLFIIEHSSNSYALFFAVSAVMKMFTKSWTVFSPEVTVETRNQVITFLMNHCSGGGVANYVMRSAEHLLVRLAKLCWHTAEQNQQQLFVGMIGNSFFKDSPDRHKTGLDILSALVQEMGDQKTCTLGIGAHTKLALRFRDNALLGVFCHASDTLKAADKFPPAVVDAAAQLAYDCVSYNFLGAAQDETAESSASVQFPMTWKPFFEDTKFPILFFRLYAQSQPPTSCLMLDIISQLMSARRSLFSSDLVRSQFLSLILDGIKQLIEAQSGLNKPENHLSLCRLICRVKNNFQIQQLLSYEGWGAWIECIFRYTMSIFSSWRWTPNCIHYLMSFWSRIVSALTYASSGTNPGALPQYIPQIVEGYIRTRLDSVDVALQGSSDEENPLGNLELLDEHLSLVSSMARFDYKKTEAFIVGIVDPYINALRTIKDHPEQRPPPSQRAQMQRVFGHLAWCVHIIGTLIRGRMTISSSDDADCVDGELSARVITLFQTTDAILFDLQRTQQPQAQNELRLCLEKDSFESYLELAYLCFCHQFRSMYIGDTSVSCSKAFSRLGELIGVSSHTTALSMIVTKVTNNLKIWKTNQAVMTKTLSFFQDVSSGYCSGKLLAKLDVIGSLLTYHSDNAFAFPLTKDGIKQCTLFYTSLGKMLSSDDHSDKFAVFAKPIEDNIRGLLSQPNVVALQQPQCKEVAARTLAQLLGLFSSAAAPFYSVLFEWLHPQFSMVIPRLAEAYADNEPLLMKLIMKLVCEMSNNRASRIRFESSSPNGILLFKDICSPTIAVYSSKLVTHLAQVATLAASNAKAVPAVGGLGQEREEELQEAKQKEFAAHYRGVALCIDPLTNCLSGEFVNFSVFALYGDKCFEVALQGALQVIFTVAPEEVIRFPKLSKSCFNFFEALSRTQPGVVCSLSNDSFLKMFLFLLAGLSSLDSITSSCCCNILTNVFTYYIRSRSRPAGSFARNAATSFEGNLSSQPALFGRLFGTLFNIILFGECQYLYTIARPLQQMYTIAPQQLSETKALFVNCQSSESLRNQLLAAFNDLEKDVGDPNSAALARSTSPSVMQKSKDSFSQSIVSFAAAVKPFISGCVSPSLP